MHPAFHAALSLGAMLGLTAAAAPRNASVPLAGPGHDLAARLEGKWTGEQTSVLATQPQHFTMVWSAAPGRHLIGMIMPSGRPHYEVNVVWSSDTAFIYESAPHYSPMLHENVINRGLVHFKGNKLEGSVEARPTRYEGKTVKGTFSAARKS